MRLNRARGRASRQKVWDTIALIEFKRKYKFSHQAVKPIRVESDITPESLAVEGDERDEAAIKAAMGEDDDNIILVDPKWENHLNTYEERKAKREKELWEKRFASMAEMQQMKDSI